MQVTVKDIRKALRKAKSEFAKGVRYYDTKHNSYNPAWYSDNILEHVSDLIDYYGIESYEPGDNNPSHPKYSYINSGDSYRLTLVYNHRSGRFSITDIGTIIEREEYA
jgi:enolase